MILGTAGHIDHGKTTLVRVLTGVDTDRLPEEKRRGITIELGFAPLMLEGFGTVGIVDVPGHEAFVRTMVAGATGIDMALVVVAADEGVMPQTREHLAILELLGVERGVVALTKVDLVDAEWLALVLDDVQAFTSRVLPQARLVATSAQTGAGIPELRSALRDLARSVPIRENEDLFRLPVDRVFTVRGTGTVATGTVWSGRLGRDDTVRILPGNRTARVRGIQGHGAQLDLALPGARTAIALVGIDVADIARGSTIVTDGRWRPTTMARADVKLVSGLAVSLRPRTWYRLHVGTSEVGARIVGRGAQAAGSDPFPARIVLDAPLLLRAGDRFVVRASAPLNTIAGGVITDPYAPKRPRPWTAGASVSERLHRMVEESAAQGVDVGTLPVRLGLPPNGCRRLVEASKNDVIVAGQLLVARQVFHDLQRRLVDRIDRYHVEHPLDPGVPSQFIRSALGAAFEIGESVLQSKLIDGSIASDGALVSRAGFSPIPSPEQRRDAEIIVSLLQAAQSEPPSVEELSIRIETDASALLRYLERNGDVVQVEPNRYYETSQLKVLLDRLRSALAGGVELGPSQLREQLRLSRKFLIPVLEYCDRVGYTNRGLTGRVWRGV